MRTPLDAKRITVKVGAGTLTNAEHRVDDAYIDQLAETIVGLRKTGREIILVSSGAIRTGVERMGLKFDSLSLPEKQAAAAVGQGLLIGKYEAGFNARGAVVGQILLTRDIVQFRRSYLNARNTLLTLLRLGATPIVNENDTVATEEIMFGDNDSLSAIAAIISDSDLLVLLSDVDGFFMDNPRLNPDAVMLDVVDEITPEMRAAAGGPLAEGGFGGMTTKLAAAETAAKAGIQAVIANGRTENVLERILAGESVGTLFSAAGGQFHGKKKWIALIPVTEGKIILNPGACDMIRDGGKSLLPAGIIETAGNFDQGACVEICDPRGFCFARGLSAYSAAEIEKIKGKHTAEIEGILGYSHGEETIHRDNLALL